MNEQNSTMQTTVQRTGFLSLLTLLFIALKLTGFIDWAWWQVLLPTLIPVGIGATLLIVAGLLYLLAVLMGQTKKR